MKKSEELRIKLLRETNIVKLAGSTHGQVCCSYYDIILHIMLCTMFKNHSFKLCSLHNNMLQVF